MVGAERVPFSSPPGVPVVSPDGKCSCNQESGEGLLIKTVGHKHTQLRTVVAADPNSGVDVHDSGL